MSYYAMCRKGRFHSVSAGFARMPALKANPLRISSLALLMRNPGLTLIALKKRALCHKGRFHSVPAGFARMPALKANPLRISSLALLMRNPGLTKLPGYKLRKTESYVTKSNKVVMRNFFLIQHTSHGFSKYRLAFSLKGYSGRYRIMVG